MATEKFFRIVTRKSPLALAQTEIFKKRLREALPEVRTVTMGMDTSADRDLSQPLRVFGGKALFVKELEKDLLAGRADVAVHSLKDVPGTLADGLMIAAVLKRADAADAFLGGSQTLLADLPKGASVGTSSLRRSVQLLNKRPDLTIVSLRGNIQTRLSRLESGDLDAIVLACAGLERMGHQIQPHQRLSSSLMTPAIGQGAIALECRSSDHALRELLATVNHQETWCCVCTERAVGVRLDADCFSPLGVYATIASKRIRIHARVGNAETNALLNCHQEASVSNAADLAKTVAQELLLRGARQHLSAQQSNAED